MKTENELIAEFMGGNKSVHPNSGLEYWFIPTPTTDGHTREAKILKYDTSWDWLMPAWVKFRDINPPGFLQDLSEHDDWKHIIGSAILYDDIKTACEKLVEGIKWYNTQNS